MTRSPKNKGAVSFHRLKVRGHNMVWSVEQFVPEWLKSQTGDQLRNTVRHHIDWTLNITHGL